MVIGAWPRSSATTIRPRLVSIATGTRSSFGAGAGGGGRGGLRKCGRGEDGEQRGGKESVLHAQPHSKALMNIASTARPGLFLLRPSPYRPGHAHPGDDESSRAAGRLARFPRADQAARDEPGGLHRPVRPAGRAGAAAARCSASPRSCASRSAPAPAARSTNGTRSTSTRKMRRTAKRPLPAGRMDRQSALHFGVGLGGFSVLLMGLATNWLAAVAARRVDPLLRARLHRLAEAADRAEHRHRRRRRRLPAADRLGRGDRPCRGAAAAAVRDHLPVDAAAFLGAVAVRPVRLCGGRHPDAAGGRGRRKHAPADLPLQPADGRRGGRAVAARPDRRRLRRQRRRC